MSESRARQTKRGTMTWIIFQTVKQNGWINYLSEKTGKLRSHWVEWEENFKQQIHAAAEMVTSWNRHTVKQSMANGSSWPRITPLIAISLQSWNYYIQHKIGGRDIFQNGGWKHRTHQAQNGVNFTFKWTNIHTNIWMQAVTIPEDQNWPQAEMAHIIPQNLITLWELNQYYQVHLIVSITYLIYLVYQSIFQTACIFLLSIMEIRWSFLYTDAEMLEMLISC